MRDVLLGGTPPVTLTQPATERLARIRDDADGVVHPGDTVVVRTGSDELRWWTWARYRANATLAATLSEVSDPRAAF